MVNDIILQSNKTSFIDGIPINLYKVGISCEIGRINFYGLVDYYYGIKDSDFIFNTLHETIKW